ncbi:hypothetical protein WJX73_000326 [Symbiochloris irregularis]|uniref:CoA carboxyltransferase C-terminal domain-containing protein n=1 Tax=Symbiochloris irregularis TaxID=706552 RepID=A0AAW1PVV1_9CHLO
MSLRQLASKFKSPGTLAQFWQGTGALAPQVQEHQRHVEASQRWQHLNPDYSNLESRVPTEGYAFAHGRQAEQQACWDSRPLFEEAWLPSEEVSIQSPTELSEVSSALSTEGSSPSLESAEAVVRADPLSNASQTSLQAREHVTELLDEGTFIPVTPFAEDVHLGSQLNPDEALITGRGEINGRPVCVISQIPSAPDGPSSDHHSRQICHLMDHAMEAGVPIISLQDTTHDSYPRATPDASKAIYIPSSSTHSMDNAQHGNAASLAGFTDVLQRRSEASGVVPQLSLNVGRCSMDGAMGFALSDFAVTVRSQRRRTFQPAQSTAATALSQQSEQHRHQEQEEDDGLQAVDWAAMLPNRRQALAHMRQLLSYLPLSCQLTPPKALCIDPPDRFCPDLDCLIPDDPTHPYEVREVITSVADDGRWHEVAPHHARNIVTGFARLGGNSVGMVANAPGVLSGCLDGPAASKAARFVRFCDAFNIPLVALVDAPGFLMPPKEGKAAAVRQAAQLLYAFAEATVPKLTVILRMANGPSYGIMGSKHLHADVNLAPAMTRRHLCNELELLQGKHSKRPRKKHGNPPIC